MMPSKLYGIIITLALTFLGCGKGNDDVKFKQYMNQGEQLYAIHCTNCHQADGTGLGKLIPPINNDFAKNNLLLSACAIQNGLEGPIDINNTTYQGKMPANPNLTALEIAEILTFITNAWNQKGGLVEVNRIDSLLLHCSSL